jgi:hypothetical protein
MTTSTAFAVKKSEPAVNDAVRARIAAQHQKQEQPKVDVNVKFKDIESNPFFKAAFSEGTPDEKRETLAKILATTGTKQENRAKVEAFELFKEYLSELREQMATEIIRLTDTDTFAEMQKALAEMGNDLNKFDDSIQPLMAILEALHKLSTDGVTYDVFREITQDRKREAELAGVRKEKTDKLNGLTARIDGLNRDIVKLQEEKGLFGFGPTTQAARQAIATKQLELTQVNSDLDKMNEEVQKLNDQTPSEEKFAEYAEQKAQLRNLLDLTSEEHSARQKAVVDDALHYVETSKTRVEGVRSHLVDMTKQIENLFDANGNMTTLYAVMNEAVKEAGGTVKTERDSLKTAPENENTLQKVQREQKKEDVEQYIESLDDSERSTMLAYGDLTSQSVRIKTMRDGIKQQVNYARTLRTQGVAGVADRLSVITQAVSQAALTESGAAIKDNLERMVDSTDQIAQKETIRVAMGIDEMNKDVIKSLESLGSYGDTLRAATEISRTGLSEIRANMDKLKELAKDTRDSFHEAMSVNADVRDGTVAPTVDKTKSTATPINNPFKMPGV